MGRHRSRDRGVDRCPVDIANMSVEFRLISDFIAVPYNPISLDPAVSTGTMDMSKLACITPVVPPCPIVQPAPQKSHASRPPPGAVAKIQAFSFYQADLISFTASGKPRGLSRVD